MRPTVLARRNDSRSVSRSPPPETHTTHVTIDARMIAHSGIGTYLRGVIPRLVALRPDWTFSLLGNARELTRVVSAPHAQPVECNAPIYSGREQIGLARLIPRETSVFWAPHYNIPLLSRAPLVVTIHDLAHLRLPEYGSPLRRGYARTLLHSVRRRASAVMFDSEFTRSEFLELVGAPRYESDTVHLGLTAEWFEPGSRSGNPPLHGPYYVYVGNTKPHKNLAVLLDAFGALRAELDARLVIIGQTDGLRTTDVETASRLKATAGVSILGVVETGVLRAYIAHATALVLPSFYEGFGLPPLEAMALGCPAIVAHAASLPEVCGDGAQYFAPTDSGELASLMRRLATDSTLRATMIGRGHDWVRQFTAERTAGRVADVIQRASKV